jgi:hypothetical protein
MNKRSFEFEPKKSNRGSELSVDSETSVHPAGLHSKQPRSTERESTAIFWNSSFIKPEIVGRKMQSKILSRKLFEPSHFTPAKLQLRNPFASAMFALRAAPEFDRATRRLSGR